MNDLTAEMKKQIREFHQKHPDLQEVLLVGPVLNHFQKSWPLKKSTLTRSCSTPPLILFVDGGLQQKSKLLPALQQWGSWSRGPVPLCVGDADSAEPGNKNHFDFLFRPDKEASDLRLAFELLPPKTRVLEMWGFWGGRLDHQMIVLGELSEWLKNRKSPVQGQLQELSGEEKAVLKFSSSGELTFHHRGLFSVMSLLPNRVQIQGECDYPLEAPTELGTLSSLGLSNCARGTVKLTSSAPCFVYLYQNQNGD